MYQIVNYVRICLVCNVCLNIIQILPYLVFQKSAKN